MDNRELAGQLFMISYPGTEPDETALEWIKHRNVGGIKIFARNVGSLPSLAENIAMMQKLASGTRLRIPLFIATDQEGGWVRHIKGNTSETAGNMSLGASGIASDSFMSSFYINRQLKVLGINMNFAPTVDIYSNPENIVIGARAFSSDPAMTTELAKAWYYGSQEAGVIATAKHFPGHGRSDKDSHLTLPVIKASLDELEQSDLIPFKSLIEEGVPAIMTAHLSFPMITGDNRPVTLSDKFLKEILRGSLEFKGIIITDDIVMKGAVQFSKTAAQACLDALKNGADIVLVSRYPETFDTACNLVVQEMESNPAFRQQVIDSVKRILKVKFEYLKTAGENALYPDIEQVRTFFPDHEAEHFFYLQNCRSVSFIRRADSDSISLKGKKVLLAGPGDFLTEGLKHFSDAGTYQIDTNYYSTGKWNPDQLKQIASRYDKVVFCVTNQIHAKMLSECSIFQDKIIVFSMLTPSFLNKITWASGIAVYGSSNQSIAAGFAALAGEFVPSGKVPIPLKEGE